MAGEERSVKLKIDNVRKVFNGRNGEMVALNGVSMDIMENEFICVVGPSGCGKSTLLNIIAGLLEPTSGTVYCNGHEVHGTGTERGVVFQQYALFPWLTVKKNVMFALEMRGMKGAAAEEEAIKFLKMVDLDKFADHYPKELSGGMKQRVGLARALALEPEVLLMDEAFSALDPLIRQEMQDELLSLQDDIQKTIVFITHDLNEAFKLGDRIVLLQDGTVVQTGTPENILQAPANDYVARFVASADASQVLTAASVMKRSEDVAVLGLDGPRAALRKMRAYSIASLFVLDRHRRFVGIINAADAKQMVTEGRSDLTEITSTDIVTVSPDTSVTEIVPLMAELPYPLAVVDERRRLQGVIVRGLLLGSLVEHSKGGANAA